MRGRYCTLWTCNLRLWRVVILQECKGSIIESIQEGFGVKKNMDTIQFESRTEVGELIRVLEKYVDAYPKEKNNQTVKELYNLLDVMEMEW